MSRSTRVAVPAMVALMSAGCGAGAAARLRPGAASRRPEDSRARMTAATP